MTLVVRDEADIVDAQIAFHLNAGVDFVLAMDHESEDGTSDVLDSYARAGVLRRLEVGGPFREQEWRTSLARMAAVDHGADWVINADADQFWWPRTGTLRDALALVPETFGVVRCWDRVFVPTPDDGRHFAERMLIRFVSRESLNIPWSNYRPLPRLFHRGDPRISVARGSHRVWTTQLRELASWSPVEVLHFPWRSVEQMARKAGAMSRAFLGETRRPGGYHEVAHDAAARGSVEAHYASLTLDSAATERGLDSGALVEDRRVRDLLRGIAHASPLPSPEECSYSSVLGGDPLPLPQETQTLRAELALETVAAGEAEAVRLLRRIDELASRVAALERQ